MSRKHFQALATALAVSGATDEVIRAVADACRSFNPSFDRGRFAAWVLDKRARWEMGE